MSFTQKDEVKKIDNSNQIKVNPSNNESPTFLKVVLKDRKHHKTKINP